MAVCVLKVAEEVHLSVLPLPLFIVALSLEGSVTRYLVTVAVLFVTNVQEHGLAAGTAVTYNAVDVSVTFTFSVVAVIQDLVTYINSWLMLQVSLVIKEELWRQWLKKILSSLNGVVLVFYSNNMR